jgi:hypothetical protein
MRCLVRNIVCWIPPRVYHGRGGSLLPPCRIDSLYKKMILIHVGGCFGTESKMLDPVLAHIDGHWQVRCCHLRSRNIDEAPGGHRRDGVSRIPWLPNANPHRKIEKDKSRYAAAELATLRELEKSWSLLRLVEPPIPGRSASRQVRSGIAPSKQALLPNQNIRNTPDI